MLGEDFLLGLLWSSPYFYPTLCKQAQFYWFLRVNAGGIFLVLLLGPYEGEGGHCSHLPREEFSQLTDIQMSLQIRCLFCGWLDGSVAKIISHTRQMT